MTTAAELVPWFQIAATVVTGIGVIVSTTIGVVTLKNAQRDRVAKIQPNLLFNLGGNIVPCTLEDRNNIPGIDQETAAEYLENRKVKSAILFNDTPIGQLFNHGLGPALDVRIWFRAEDVEYSNDKFKLTDAQLNFAPYSKEWNITSPDSSNISSGEGASVYRMPTPVYLAEPNLRSLMGLTFIECKDAEGRTYQWSQPTRIFIDRDTPGKAQVTFTFLQRTQPQNAGYM